MNTRHHTTYHGGQGSALVTVLIVIVLLTATAGTVLGITSLQQRFMRTDLHRLQAFYNAEAGLQMALADDRLGGGIPGEVLALEYAFPEFGRAKVEAAVFGGFIYLESRGYAARHTAHLSGIAGLRPPKEFDGAIVLGDRQSGLTVTGDTRITGAVTVGREGLKPASFNGQAFSGEIIGNVTTSEAVAISSFDASSIRSAMLDLGDDGHRSNLIMHLPVVGSQRILRFPGDARFTEADSADFAQPLVVFADGDVHISGSFKLAEGSVLASRGNIEILGAITGRSLILSARGSIRVADAAHLDGQLLAGGSVHIDGDASITYPSLVFAEGKTDEEDETGGIRLIGRARVDGTLVVPPEDGEADDPYLQDARIILIDEDAVLRGALYSGARAEIRGGVIGSVVASSLYFYESPRHYVNWLKDAVIDRSRRPKDLAVPTGFVDSRRYVLMDQTEQSTRGDILKTDRAPI